MHRKVNVIEELSKRTTVGGPVYVCPLYPPANSQIFKGGRMKGKGEEAMPSPKMKARKGGKGTIAPGPLPYGRQKEGEKMRGSLQESNEERRMDETPDGRRVTKPLQSIQSSGGNKAGPKKDHQQKTLPTEQGMEKMPKATVKCVLKANKNNKVGDRSPTTVRVNMYRKLTKWCQEKGPGDHSGSGDECSLREKFDDQELACYKSIMEEEHEGKGKEEKQR